MRGASWRMLYGPQCCRCGRAVADEDGRDLVVDQTLLPAGVRESLAADGWTVKAGDRRRGRHDTLLGDTLTCPKCTAAETAERAAAQTAHAAAMAGPAVRQVDLAAKLGNGWRLHQRAGDADTRTWLLTHHDQVRGMVRRYQRKDGTFSTGWEALVSSDTGLWRLDATGAAKWSDKSTYLWRSRDLAAWGIATHPAYATPNPAWAARRTPGRG